MERGRPKKAKEKQRVKNKQKMPFLGENRAFLLKTKKGKGEKAKKNKKTTQKTNKEGLGPSEMEKTNKDGLGPSEVALRATSPDP